MGKETETHFNNSLDINLPFNFMAKIMLNCPEILEGLPKKNAYVLFARIDKVQVPYSGIAAIFESNEANMQAMFKNSLIKLWRLSPEEIRQQFPLINIQEAVRLRARQTLIGLAPKLLSDPKRAPLIRAKMSEGQKKSYRNNPELRKKRSRLSTGRRMPPEAVDKIRTKLTGRKLSPEHIDKIKSRKVSQESRGKMSEAQKRRFQRPEERRKLASHLGFKGKKHSLATRAKMSESSIRATIRRDDLAEISREDIALWRYAIDNDLINKILDRGKLTKRQITSLRIYFEGGKSPKNLSKLLNLLSLEVANLA